jgi:hypothetical protein
MSLTSDRRTIAAGRIMNSRWSTADLVSIAAAGPRHGAAGLSMAAEVGAPATKNGDFVARSLASQVIADTDWTLADLDHRYEPTFRQERRTVRSRIKAQVAS